MRSVWKRAAVSCVGALILVVAFPLVGFAQHAGVCYDASLGTLPDAQGWTYDGVPASPQNLFVSGGLLHENITSGNGQEWNIVGDNSVDFSRHVTFEANLRVYSSTYIPNVGTGTREGYYVPTAHDAHGNIYSLGLASQGFNVNSPRFRINL